MTTDACRLQRGAIAAAALGRIDDVEAIALRAHLDGCAECRSELAELTAVARALPLADPSRLHDDPATPSDDLASQVVDRVARERARARTRRRLRMIAVAAVLFVALGVAAVVVTRPDNGREATTVVFPASHDVRGEARLLAREAGTEVELIVEGLDDGDEYWLWLTGEDGDRVSAGTFHGTGEDIAVTLTSSLPLDAARRIWVSDADDGVVLDAQI